MIPTLINGRWPLLLPSHRAARPEWPWWEATRLAAMAAHVGPGDVVWDVGAEEGDFPALWASWGAEVVLAEPNPRVWPNIRTIFEANVLQAPVASFVGFLGEEDTAGWASALVAAGEWPTSAYGPVIGDHGFCQLGERPDIETVTIDTFTEVATRPSVITMDVEGAELHVLHGARRTLTEHRPKVFVSVHPGFMAHHYGHNPEQLYDFMEELGYQRTFLTEDHERHEMFLPR